MYPKRYDLYIAGGIFVKWKPSEYSVHFMFYSNPMDSSLGLLTFLNDFTDAETEFNCILMIVLDF